MWTASAVSSLDSTGPISVVVEIGTVLVVEGMSEGEAEGNNGLGDPGGESTTIRRRRVFLDAVGDGSIDPSGCDESIDPKRPEIV